MNTWRYTMELGLTSLALVLTWFQWGTITLAQGSFLKCLGQEEHQPLGNCPNMVPIWEMVLWRAALTFKCGAAEADVQVSFGVKVKVTWEYSCLAGNLAMPRFLCQRDSGKRNTSYGQIPILDLVLWKAKCKHLRKESVGQTKGENNGLKDH